MKKSKKGFTLIEIVIVVAVLCVIVALAYPYVSDIMSAARTTSVEANLKTLNDCEARILIDEAKRGIE